MAPGAGSDGDLRPLLPRRDFLAAGVAGCAEAAISGHTARAEETVPPVDLHVHLDNSTIDKVVELGQQRGVRFGIVEHAGTKENKYPTVLSNDDELGRYLAMLDGKGVYRGVQTEWHDWPGCFSRQAVARLDYVLTDAMTFPGKDGRRVKLWEKDAPERVDMSNPQAFMDRYVDWYLAIIRQQPIDVLANVSWLPPSLAEQYEVLWTAERIKQVVAAAVKHGLAIEISSSYRLPKLYFLEIAKSGRAKFTFGSNGRYPNMGKLDYSLDMARQLRLAASDFFRPGVDGQKAVQRRWKS